MAHQAPLSMGFPRQEYWSGGIQPCLLSLLHWQADSLPLNHLGSLLECSNLQSTHWAEAYFIYTQGWPKILCWKALRKFSSEKEEKILWQWHLIFLTQCVTVNILKLFWLPVTENNRKQLQFSSVQSLSHVRLFATPWIAARQASLSITNSQSSLKLMSIESVMPSSHLIFCRPLLLLPPIPPSIRVFSNESTLLMRCPKYWSFSFSISPSNEHPGLISLRMDWLYLLAVQGTINFILLGKLKNNTYIKPKYFM